MSEIGNLSYGACGDFELNFGRFLPSLQPDQLVP
jgi:hypothetical protein